jgi:hypothetical protein
VYVPAKFDPTAPLKEDIFIRETPEGDIETIQFVKSCVYLGAKITNDLTDVAEITGRMVKASQMFGMLRRDMLASKDTWPEVKKRILEGMIIPTMLDGAEHWVVGADQRRELNSLFNRMVRSCLRMTIYTTRKYHITTQATHEKIGVGNLDHYLDLRVLGYAGHVERMGPERLPKILRDSYLVLPQKRGRPIRSQQDQVRDALKRKKIGLLEWKTLARNRTKWREAIRAPPVYATKCKPHAEWTKSPDSLIGCLVEKQFGHKWYSGEITESDIDIDTSEIMWRVLYDDGDEADYNAKQLDKIICECE